MDKSGLDRRRFLCGLASTATVLAGWELEAKEVRAADVKPQVNSTRNFSALIGALPGFSVTLIREHLALLDRYRHKLAETEAQRTAIDLSLPDALAGQWRSNVLTWTELHNAVRLHELYFSTLSPRDSKPGPIVSSAIGAAFGSVDQWWVQFRATAEAIRGWTILGWDLHQARLWTCGLDSDSEWPLHVEPLLVVDVNEHAYVLDFVGQRRAYLEAWRARVAWSVVEARLEQMMDTS
jgi:Fe-Mn family superoxide dismutase